MHASGGGRIPEPPKVAAVTTEAQQRRRAVLILYCTLTLSHYALLLVTVMSDEDKSWILGSPESSRNITAKSEKKKRVLRFLVSWPNIADWQCT